jgi:multiple sugar transport system permease protein
VWLLATSLLIVSGASVCQIVENEGFRGEKTTIRLAFWQADYIDAFTGVCRSFVDLHPDIRVKIEADFWTAYWTKIRTQTAGRVAPDVWEISTDKGSQAIWFSKGACLDLTPFIHRDRIHLSDHIPAAGKAVVWNDRTYGLPMGAAVRIFMYNKRLFDDQGLPYLDPDKPLTWEELVELGRKLTVVENGEVVQYGLSWSYGSLASCIQQAGGRFVDNYENPARFTANTPEFKEGLQFYYDTMFTHRIAPVLSQQKDLGFEQPDYALLSGRVAIMVSGYFALPRLLEVPDLDFGLAPVAMGKERGQEALINLFCVDRRTKHPDQAWELVKFLGSEEGQMLLLQNGGPDIPTHREVITSSRFLNSVPGVDNLHVFVDELGEFALSPPAIPTDRFNREFQNILERLYLGTLSPDQAAELIQVEGTRVLAELEGPEISTAMRYGYPAAILAVLLLFGVALYLRSRAVRKSREMAARGGTGDNRPGFLMLLPWLTGFLLFVLGPVVAAFVLSFTEWDLVGNPRWIGAMNYSEMFTRDWPFINSILVTLLYVVCGVTITVVVALWAAALVQGRTRFRGAFRAVYYLPSLVAGVALCFVFAWMFNVRYGIINTILGFVGIQGPEWLFRKGWALTALISVNLFYIGGNMLIFLAALQNVPRQYYEAAEIDGASPVRQFFHITLPQITPSILFCLIVGTIVAFQVFTEPYVMTDGGPDQATNFFILHLYNKAFKDLEMGYASSLAVVLFVLIFLITFIQLRTSKRWVYYEAE